MIKIFLPKSEFSRNVLTLMTGTTIAQAVPIAISPILTRLYSPEEFGVLALYMSIASLLSVIATGRYEMAIMLPEKEIEAFNIVVLSLSIAVAISFLSLIIVFIFNDQITLLLDSPKISDWLYFIPLSTLLTGAYQSFNYWNNRKKNYKLISTSRILRSGTRGFSNLTFGFGGYTYGGLILGGLIGQFVSTLFLGKELWKRDKGLIEKISKKEILSSAKKYKKFPLINSFHAFINILKENSVNIFIAAKYSQSTLGYFYFMLRIMKLPAGLLGSSIAQVFYREASEKYNKEKDIQNLVAKLVKKLFLISLLPILFLYVFSEDLFSIVFGEEWAIAGIYARAISPYILFHFIASPMGMIPLITNKQEKSFFWGLFESVLFVGIFVFGYVIFKDLEKTLNVLSVLMGVYFLIYFIWIYMISKEEL